MLERKKEVSSSVVRQKRVQVIADFESALLNLVRMIFYQLGFRAEIAHYSLKNLVVIKTSR